MANAQWGPSRSFWKRWAAPGLLLGLCAGCVPAHRAPTWSTYPLQRRLPHDGLAVVSQPDGFGLHIWIDIDTSQAGVCRPRWTPDAARLFNGNGTAPFSSGLASRLEFFQAVARSDVQKALRKESEALCRSSAPGRRFQWQQPPLRPQDVKPQRYPLLEEPNLLSDPSAVERSEQQLLLGEPTAP
ncbi:MAG: hypothetical protein VKK98_08700 [Cyanobacteriota bacterium]|nr:hypothetical protein [Cyanobacteriota bacterium]